jgi:hypothetical protein
LVSLIRTKFLTHSFDELFTLLWEMEDKLDMWKEKNTNCTWDVEVLIGEYEYIIIVTVDNEDNN